MEDWGGIRVVEIRFAVRFAVKSKALMGMVLV